MHSFPVTANAVTAISTGFAAPAASSAAAGDALRGPQVSP